MLMSQDRLLAESRGAGMGRKSLGRRAIYGRRLLLQVGSKFHVVGDGTVGNALFNQDALGKGAFLFLLLFHGFTWYPGKVQILGWVGDGVQSWCVHSWEAAVWSGNRQVLGAICAEKCSGSYWERIMVDVSFCAKSDAFLASQVCLN